MRGKATTASNRARAASGPLAFVFLHLPFSLLLLAVGTSARAQTALSRADSAEVLAGTAERLHEQGSTALAGAIARLVQRRYADTPASARAAALLATLRATERSRSGRVGLIAFSTIYGAWLGVALPLMAEADDPEAYGLGLLAGAPVGFFGGRAFANDRSISAGDAGLVTWSGTWGSWQGGGWMAVLGDDDDCTEFDCYEVDPEASDIVGASVLGGLAGIAASAFAASRTDVTGGTATMIGWSSLWGSGAGLVVSVLAELQGDEILAAALLGGDAGFAAAALLAPRWHMSSGRAWLVNAAGIMGGAIGGGVDLLIQPSDEKLAVMIPAIGSAIGLGLGARLTRGDADDDDRVREGALTRPRGESPALLRRRDGEWAARVPQPAFVLLREDGSRAAELGVRLELLDVRF